MLFVQNGRFAHKLLNDGDIALANIDKIILLCKASACFLITVDILSVGKSMLSLSDYVTSNNVVVVHSSQWT
jgi:hypothetical protein